MVTQENNIQQTSCAFKVYNPSERRNTHTAPRRTYKNSKNRSNHAKQEDESEKARTRTYRKYPKRVMTEVTQAECHKLRLEPINNSDPCSAFPHEIWHMVLDSFPMSRIVKLSLVSKTWLAGSREYLGFKVAAMNGQLGEPKVKYKTWMSLTCSNAEFVCEYCFGYSAGRKVTSHIPIKIQLNGDPLETWALCHNCRNRHYRLRPEEPRAPCNPLDLRTYIGNSVIFKTAAMQKYALKPADLDGIQHYKRTFGHAGTVFLERDIQVQACQIHGGWIGLEAVKANLKAYRLQLVKEKEKRYRQYMSMIKETAKSNRKVDLEGKKSKWPRTADKKQPTETAVSYKDDSKVSDDKNDDKPLKEEKVEEKRGENTIVEYRPVEQIVSVQKFKDNCLEDDDAEKTVVPQESMLWTEDRNKYHVSFCDLFGAQGEYLRPILFEYDDVADEFDQYCNYVAAGLEDEDWHDGGTEDPSSRGGSQW
ncbi:hypothetical protein BGZ81_002412 [Podila clonocystis]|nr:hypothetical protein BGZ81_002412 [Podila clonocystis]